MSTVKEWEGSVPVVPRISGFSIKRYVRVIEESGDEYFAASNVAEAGAEGEKIKRIHRVVRGPARQAALDASLEVDRLAMEKDELNRANAEALKAKIDAVHSNDAEWAKLTTEEKTERTRIVQLGLLGLTTGKPELVAKANDALAAVPLVVPDVPADLGPALEVKP